MTDAVKQQVAAHWDRRASHFDDDFGHSIRTPAERAAWDRILHLVLRGLPAGDALDVGCGTGFLSFELAARAMALRFEHGDAERLTFTSRSFDLVMTRHVLWTLPHPETAHQLPYLGGRSREQIVALFEAHGLVAVGSDPLLDLVAAQAQRMIAEGREQRTRRRFVVWGVVTS